MLNRVIKEKLFTAVGQVGFYPANSRGDDIDIFSPTDGENKSTSSVLYGIRQQVGRSFFETLCSDLIYRSASRVAEYFLFHFYHHQNLCIKIHLR